jgi:hypothetical protein
MVPVHLTNGTPPENDRLALLSVMGGNWEECGQIVRGPGGRKRSLPERPPSLDTAEAHQDAPKPGSKSSAP